MHVKEGIYLGNALVTNREGKAHMRIINSTDEDCNVVVPTIEILPFEERSYKRCNLTKISKENRFEEILKLLRLDHLNKEEKENVIQLIKENEDRFHLAGEILEGTDSIQHRIHTTDDIPINTRQYRYPPVHKDEINRQINELLETGVIESSSSPYSSPIWIVPKKPDSTGKKRWRVVIDYRKLNEKTIGDAYPLPNITEILDQLGSAKYFSIFDLASGFHQIKMAPDDAHKTAFSTPYGHYQFTRMPFGLKNAPATFQRLMNSVLSGLQGTELFVYLDDIVIYSRSLREHEIKLTRLMKRLREAKLMLQPDKCEFLRHEVIYLGHIIDEHGVKPDPKNIEAVENFPRPKTPKNIKQFLGLIGYYRRFIPEFSRKSKPLTNLLKKTTKFIWDKEEEEAFQILKKALISKPILQYPDFSQPFKVTTDASGYAIGGVLSQEFTGDDLPIAYASRLLNTAEQNYSTIEKECLAIIYCVTHFRPYLYGRKFKIETDHKPLVWMNSIKDPNSRIWKWKLKLSDYEFEINYKKGKSNLNADALSRNPPEVCLPIRAREEEEPPEGEPPQKKNLRSTSSEDFKGPMTRSRHLAFPNRELKYLEFPKRRRKRIPIPEESKDEDMEQNTFSSETSRNKEQKRKRTLSSDLSIAAPSPKRKIHENSIDIAGTSQEEEESIETTETLQEMELIETTGTLQEEESMETTETPQDEKSMEIIDISPSPPQLSPRTTTSRSEDTIPHQNQLVIRESRDSLAKIKDNKVIFIGLDGSPIDKGAKELETENLLPNHVDLTVERARPVPDGVRYIISLPINENPRTVIRPDNILNGLMSLWDVITEFDLKSFSISRTHNIEDIP